MAAREALNLKMQVRFLNPQPVFFLEVFLMYLIEGIERLDYKNKQERRVTGYRVHFTYDLPAGGEHSGRACDSVFLSDSSFVQCGVSVGDSAIPVYNKFGRCTGFMEDVNNG